MYNYLYIQVQFEFILTRVTTTLHDFERFLCKEFQDYRMFIALYAVHEGILTFVCTVPASIKENLVDHIIKNQYKLSSWGLQEAIIQDTSVFGCDQFYTVSLLIYVIFNPCQCRWARGLQCCCLSVCLSVCWQNSRELMKISTLKILPADFKSYKGQKYLLKPFCFKVKTIFVTHSRRFTTFRRHLVAKQFTETQLILLKSLSNHSLK